MRSHLILLSVLLSLSIISSDVFSLPIDWNGAFGVDSNLIQNYRKTNDDVSTTNGSQVVPNATGNDPDASFQSYIFKLDPTIIVNDSATIFAEITTGYASGGMLGDNFANRASSDRSYGNSLYMQSTSTGNSNLQLKKFYAELYSDTATFVLGRQTMHWGLGAVFNDGHELWDRHATIFDGGTAKLKLGNFNFAPFWGKLNSSGSLTQSTNFTTYGISALYDNIDKDLVFGVSYSKRISYQHNTVLQSSAALSGATINMGATDVKFADIYLKKTMGRLDAGVEVPLISGKAGQIFKVNEGSTTANPKQSLLTKYGAKGFISEVGYTFNDTWKVKLHAGYLSGEDGDISSYNALYLNPNYQIAYLMFKHNYYAIGNTNQNVYDSYMTNARYLKLSGHYDSDPWSAKLEFIYALANEVAKVGQSYNHEKNYVFTGVKTQSDNLGFETDFHYNYQWNANVNIGGILAYYFVGDYYAYTNATKSPDLKNVYAAQFRADISF